MATLKYKISHFLMKTISLVGCTHEILFNTQSEILYLRAAM